MFKNLVLLAAVANAEETFNATETYSVANLDKVIAEK